MTEKGLLRVGIIATVVTAVCCTPVLARPAPWGGGPLGGHRMAGLCPLACARLVSLPHGPRALEDAIRMIELQSTITCQYCGHRHTEAMPTDFCQFFYDCKGCAELLRPKQGDCCVFCSYGTVPCPPVQEANEKAGQPSNRRSIADAAERHGFEVGSIGLPSSARLA